MQGLMAYVLSKPVKRKKPNRLNVLDLAPLNNLEKQALYELHLRSLVKDNALDQVLQELVNRLSRSLAAYQNAYPIPYEL